MSLKLQERSVEIGGSRYPLKCNMSVLERLQDGPGKGEIGNLMKRPAYQVIFEILKAMLDDACEDHPELQPVPMKTLKKLYSPAQLGEMGVFRMFVGSLSVSTSDPDTEHAEEQTPDDSGN